MLHRAAGLSSLTGMSGALRADTGPMSVKWAAAKSATQLACRCSSIPKSGLYGCLKGIHRCPSMVFASTVDHAFPSGACPRLKACAWKG